MPDYYRNDIEYLMDEMKHLDSKLQDLISRKGLGDDRDPFKGLYLSEKEADALLGGDAAKSGGQGPPGRPRRRDPLPERAGRPVLRPQPSAGRSRGAWRPARTWAYPGSLGSMAWTTWSANA